MLSCLSSLGLLLLFGTCGVLEVSAVSDRSQVMMRRQEGMPDPALMDTTDRTEPDDRRPPPEALDADFEEVRRVALEQDQKEKESPHKIEESLEDDNGRMLKPEVTQNGDDLAQAGVMKDENGDGTQGYLDPKMVDTGPDPNRASQNRAPGGTSLMGTASESTPIQNEPSVPDPEQDDHSELAAEEKEAADSSDDAAHAVPAPQHDHDPDGPSHDRDLPTEHDRPTNEMVMTSYSEQQKWEHPGDEERARLDPSASLLENTHASPHIVHAIRKAMRDEINGFKGYMNAALSPGDGASLIEERSLSKVHRDDPAINMFDRVNDIFDGKPSPVKASVPGRATPIEAAQMQAEAQDSAMKEADLAMKEMDASTIPDFSKGAVKISDLDDNENLLVPKNGATLSSATTPTSMSQTGEDSVSKALSVEDILNGGADKGSDRTQSVSDDNKEPDGELLLEAQKGSLSAMKKLAQALKRKNAQNEAASLLDQKASAKKAESKKADLFADIMSDTGATDKLPAPKPTTLKETDVFAAATPDNTEKDLVASLGQTEASVAMKPDERTLFESLSKEADKQDQKDNDIFAALDKAPAASKAKNDENLFADLGKPSADMTASTQGGSDSVFANLASLSKSTATQGSDSLLDSLSKPTPAQGSDNLLDSLNQPMLQASATESAQKSQNILSSLTKDEQSVPKVDDLSNLLKQLKA